VALLLLTSTKTALMIFNIISYNIRTTDGIMKIACIECYNSLVGRLAFLVVWHHTATTTEVGHDAVTGIVKPHVRMRVVQEYSCRNWLTTAGIFLIFICKLDEYKYC